MNKLYAIVIAVLLSLLVACSPAPVAIVVTATPAAIATTQPTAFPSKAPAVVTTPTRESYLPHEGCSVLNAAWDDPISGCAVNRNPNFVSGFSATSVGDTVIFLPRDYTLTTSEKPFPVICSGSTCVANVQWTKPQASVGYEQVLSKIEQGQCYLLKSVWSYKVRSEGTNWTENILFAGARAGTAPWTWQAFPAPIISPDKNGFVYGLFESVLPYRGGSNPTPRISVSLRVQWGVLTGDSTVSLSGIYVFAAPKPCPLDSLPLE